MGRKRSVKKATAQYTMRYLDRNGEWALESHWDNPGAAAVWAAAMMKKQAFTALRLYRADGTIAHRWGKDELTPLEVWAHERGITGSVGREQPPSPDVEGG